MTDLLVKLYEPLPDAELAGLAGRGIVVRRALAPEKRAAEAWVAANFGEPWAGEVAVAFARRPLACFLAVAGTEMLGFACYDAVARGFFGPTGVGAAARRGGVGKALLVACLADMREQGYGYAIIGGVGPAAFYEKAVGAVAIPGSDPGIYRRLVRYP